MELSSMRGMTSGRYRRRSLEVRITGALCEDSDEAARYGARESEVHVSVVVLCADHPQGRDRFGMWQNQGERGRGLGHSAEILNLTATRTFMRCLLFCSGIAIL